MAVHASPQEGFALMAFQLCWPLKRPLAQIQAVPFFNKFTALQFTHTNAISYVTALFITQFEVIGCITCTMATNHAKLPSSGYCDVTHPPSPARRCMRSQ